MEKPDFRNYENSEEGLAQYDAAVAAYNRQQEGPKIGTELADKIEGAVGFLGEQASKIPFVSTGLQYLGGSVKTVDQVMSQDQGVGGMVYRTYKNVKSASEEGFGDLAENVGVDRRYGSFFGGELIDTAVTAGAGAIAKRAMNVVDKLPPGGMSQQLATATASPMGLAPSASNGSISLRQQVMEAVTSTNQRVNTAVGVKPGDSMYDASGMQGKQLLRRDKNIDDYRETISLKNDEIDALRELKGDPKNLQEFVNNSSPELQKYWETEKGNVNKIIDRLTDNKKNAQEGLSRAESNVLPFVSTKEAERIQDFKNVNYFRSTIGLSEKKAEQTARKIKGYLEQHHLFPKGMSAAFFGKMDELISKGVATKDDLILMAEFASVKGRRAGDIKANLLNMQQTPHNRMHTELRSMGAELSKSDYQRLLKDVDNVDDLLDRWADLFEPGIEGDAVYNAAVAELWEPMDDLIGSVSPKYTGEAKSNPALFN